MNKDIRIALAADTILYLPVYLLERDGPRPGQDFHVTLLVPGESESKGGDQYAYDLVKRGDAQLCLCDPMVTVPKSRDQALGIAVATMVSRVGLWGITTPFFDLDVPWDQDVIEYVTGMPGKTISSVLTYKSSSSGQKALDYLRQWVF